MNKDSMTIGLHADLSSGEGDISPKNMRKLEELIQENPMLAWDVIGDWIDELTFLRGTVGAAPAAQLDEDDDAT